MLSAGLTALALPPWDFWPFAWIALVPFFLALRDVSPVRGFWLGLLWGTAEHWATAYWVIPAMAYYYEQPWWFAVLFGVFSSLVYRGLFYGFIGFSLAAFGRRMGSLARVVFTAALWVAVELIRMRGPTADPWLLIGYALLPYERVVQIADLGGIHALSFLVVLVNAALAEVVYELLGRKRSLNPFHPDPLPSGRRNLGMTVKLARASATTLLFALIPLAASWVYGTLKLSGEPPSEPAVPLMIVQGNNDYGAQWSPEFYGKGLDEYLRLSLQASRSFKPELLVWPESAVTFFLAREPRQERRVRQLLHAIGSDLVVGAPHYEGTDPAVPEFLNSAFYLTPEDGIIDRYDKITLLPFAEYFPLRFSQFLRRNFGRVRSFTPGADTRPLRTRFGPMAVAICFEAVHPEEVRKRMARGAVALLNLSNDGWLGKGAGPRQHFAMARLRAVENRTWLIRSTTTGISAVVDPYGRVVEELPLFQPGVLDATFVPFRHETTYQRWGDWLAFGCLVLASCIGAILTRDFRSPISLSRNPPAPIREPVKNLHSREGFAAR